MKTPCMCVFAIHGGWTCRMERCSKDEDRRCIVTGVRWCRMLQLSEVVSARCACASESHIQLCVRFGKLYLAVHAEVLCSKCRRPRQSAAPAEHFARCLAPQAQPGHPAALDRRTGVEVTVRCASVLRKCALYPEARDSARRPASMPTASLCIRGCGVVNYQLPRYRAQCSSPM